MPCRHRRRHAHPSAHRCHRCRHHCRRHHCRCCPCGAARWGWVRRLPPRHPGAGAGAGARYHALAPPWLRSLQAGYINTRLCVPSMLVATATGWLVVTRCSGCSLCSPALEFQVLSLSPLLLCQRRQRPRNAAVSRGKTRTQAGSGHAVTHPPIPVCVAAVSSNPVPRSFPFTAPPSLLSGSLPLASLSR